MKKGEGRRRDTRPARAKSARGQRVDERLAPYRGKRRFERTPEPSGDASPRRAGARPRYVIQKHAARNLHYDFRLEHEGVLWSWSVPKGPSLDPADRRLAVRTEDHPLDYADFEGVIPKGEYGGGTVMVWDTGSWEPQGDAAGMMEKGHLTFVLHGRKLTGRWHLVRTRGAGKRENWLLFKGRDEAASVSTDVLEAKPESVASGRSLEQIGSARDRVWHSNHGGGSPAEILRQLRVGFAFTNLEKVLYPEIGLTKADLVAYYALVADRLLPQVAGRPLTLVRCPEGHTGSCFFQKHANAGVPDVVDRIEIREEDGSVGIYMAIHDVAGLLAAPQLGALELHTWVSHVDDLEHPDQLVFDIDPDEDLPFERVALTAQLLRQRLGDLGLESFVKTTGGKGLHVVAPVKPRHSWDEHKDFAYAVALSLEREAPDRYTTNARKARRKGRIYLDYLRNGRGATAVAPYSTRRRPGAPVATPLTWSELEHGIDPKKLDVIAVAKRLAKLAEDPWAGYAKLRQSIRESARRKLPATR
ncbi:MAG TPA: non-homologous end-joining DNA ligase [Myxococcota bacterium]|nr:non-homologous end-joining DNA ligase [Myxococcota bacterium]